jgi:ribonuclease P protein component
MREPDMITSVLIPGFYGIIMLYTETLNENKDFLMLYKKGRFTASKYVVIYVRQNGLPFNRLGITAGKKIGNAVCRNRAKRLIRLAYRESEINLPVGIDIVIVARKPICEIKSQELCGYMQKYAVPEIVRMSEQSRGNGKKQ